MTVPEQRRGPQSLRRQIETARAAQQNGPADAATALEEARALALTLFEYYTSRHPERRAELIRRCGLGGPVAR